MIVSEHEAMRARRQVALPQDALVDLMDRYEARLQGYLNNLLRDEDAVRDLVQEAFLRAYEQLRRGKPVNGPWLYTVGRNLAIDRLRQQKLVRTDFETVLESPAAEGETKDFQRALQRLPSDDAELLYLFSVDRFHTAEIAEMLGILPGTVRTRLFRARERLRALYQTAEGET